MRDKIGVGHLLALPAILIYCDGRREFFGDGSMCQLAPILPAIHLGVSKVLVIGASRRQEVLSNAPSFAPLSKAWYKSLATHYPVFFGICCLP